MPVSVDCVERCLDEEKEGVDVVEQVRVGYWIVTGMGMGMGLGFGTDGVDEREESGVALGGGRLHERRWCEIFTFPARLFKGPCKISR